MNRDSKIQKHISILESAISKGLVYESHDWRRVEDHSIHVLEFEIKIDQTDKLDDEVVNNEWR